MQMRPWLFPLLVFLTISCRGIIPSPTDAAFQQYLEEHGMTPEDEDVEGPATLTGRVLDSEGQPLEHGRVLVYRHKPGRRKSEGPMAATELEGPDREFRFVLNAPMSCFVYVDPDSIPPGSLSPPRRSLAEALKDGNGTVRVVDAGGGYASLQAGDEAHVELVVGRPGRVVGRLVDREGEPIAEALVDIGAAGMRGTHHERTTTDEQGRFRLDPVFPGHLRLIFSYLAPQRNPPPVDFRLHGGQTLDLGTIRIPRGDGKILRGVVVNQDGQPFVDLRIECLFGGDPPEGWSPYRGVRIASTTTGEDGSFVLKDLPALPMKVNLTPGWGRGSREATLVPAIDFDWAAGGNEVDLGVHVVEERRP